MPPVAKRPEKLQVGVYDFQRCKIVKVSFIGNDTADKDAQASIRSVGFLPLQSLAFFTNVVSAIEDRPQYSVSVPDGPLLQLVSEASLNISPMQESGDVTIDAHSDFSALQGLPPVQRMCYQAKKKVLYSEKRCVSAFYFRVAFRKTHQ